MAISPIYLATLTKDTPSPLLPKDDQISISEDKPAGPQGPGKPGEAKDAKSVDVKIDTDGIFNRIIKLPVRMMLGMSITACSMVVDGVNTIRVKASENYVTKEIRVSDFDKIMINITGRYLMISMR